MNNSSLWQDALRRLIQNRAAMIGGITILILIILAIFAPLIAPYSYSYQNLDIGASPPSVEHLLGTDVLGRDIVETNDNNVLLYIYSDGYVKKVFNNRKIY